MKIAIDALGIHYVGGGRTATMTLLESLFELDHQNEYRVFLSQPEPSLQSSAGNVHQVVIPFKNRFLLRVWAQLFLPSVAHGVDVVHFSKNLGAFGIGAQSVVTMYDMTTLVHPELLPKFDVWYWKTIQKRTLHSAARVIAISQATADDLIRFYQLPAEKIRVIYPAIARHFKPASDQEIQNIRKKYGLENPYLIHVGRLDRKKNIPFLIESFAGFQNLANQKVDLALVGEVYPKSIDATIQPTLERCQLGEAVRFTGRVPDQDLPALYSGALASVLTSLHEGFGLAPIEAMACGTPLVAYSSGAIPEMAGGAALLIDRLDSSQFSAAMVEVLSNPDRRQALRQAGLARAAQFNGRQTASQTLDLYREIAKA
jgi:glycosyltransferase involved in cell wall biosynthesis